MIVLRVPRSSQRETRNAKPVTRNPYRNLKLCQTEKK